MGTTNKGLIGKEDIDLYDGKNLTFSRMTSSGGTGTYTSIDFMGVDVLQVYGSGSNRTDSTLTSALVNIGSTTKVVLYLSSGTWVLSNSITMGSNIYLQLDPNALIQPASGKSLTVYSPANIIAAPNQQIIDTTNNSIDPLLFTNGGYFGSWWIGIVADGDGAGGGSNNSSLMQLALNMVEDNANLNVSIPRGIYRFDTGLTLLRDAVSDNKRLIIDANGSTFDFSGMSAGTGLTIGASGSGTVADDGEIILKNFYLLGPESANPTSGTLTSPTTPDGSTVGLKLDYALNVTMENVVIKRFYNGIYSRYSFPIKATNVSLHQNYIGLYVFDVNTISNYTALGVKECRYGVVIRPTYNLGSVSSQTFTNLHLEDNHVGFVVDQNQGGNDDTNTTVPAFFLRGLTIINPYVASNDGDIFRFGIPWTFANPDSRGSTDDHAVNVLSGLTIIGGHWNYSYSGSGTLKAPIVFDSGPALLDSSYYTSGSVHGAHIEAAIDADHIVGNPRNTQIITHPRQDETNFVLTDFKNVWYDDGGNAAATYDHDNFNLTADAVFKSVSLYDSASENMPQLKVIKQSVDMSAAAVSFGIYTVPANSSFIPIAVNARIDDDLAATNGNYWAIGIRAANRRVDYGVCTTAAASSKHSKNAKLRWLNSSELSNQIAVAADVIQLISVDGTTDSAGDGSAMGGAAGDQATVIITGWLLEDLADL